MSAADLVLLAIGVGLVPLLMPGWRARPRLVAGAVMSALVILGIRLTRPPARAAEPASPTSPARTLRGVYAGSESCQSCHPGEHASWSRTYHRTMTQRPRPSGPGRPSTVLSPLPTGTFTVDGESYALVVDGERVRVERRGPQHAREPTRPVILSTGSHHYQAYWTEGRRPGELELLPFVYLVSEGRFVPRRSVFLTPDDAPPRDLAWSASCIQCHAVGGRPRRDEDGTRFETDVAELGVACEACHGPGGAHVERHRDPFARAWARQDPEPDVTIVNPAKLDAAGSVAVCAQCHSLSFPRDEAAFWRDGTSTPRPDQTFLTRTLLTYEALGTRGNVAVDAPRESLFWPDGTIRIGGREANAHLLSPCFLRGEGDRKPSCLSCHSMHASEPNDQLARGKGGDGACLSCHRSFEGRIAAHTFHAPESEGSRCVACHMPKTTFALLGAIATHRIESPRVRATGDRLPACNLCHADQSLGWTAAHLARWYGRRERPEDEALGAVTWLLAGDAAKRALAAAHLGEPASRAASGATWQPPLLARLLEDPYAAVRFVAARSLRTFNGFERFEFDFVGPAEQRRKARDVATTLWVEQRAGLGTPAARRGRVLLKPDGASDTAHLDELTSQRDDRKITIAE